MGGFFSGGGRMAPKTSEFRRIDLARLRELGMVKPNQWIRARLVWTRNGEETGSVMITSDDRQIVLDYRVRDYGGEWEPIKDTIPLEYTNPNFGGARAWFVCPNCYGRKRVLYGGRLFRCRTCYRATYPSQYEPDYMRWLERAQRIRDKLGGSACTEDPFPEKPKRMRWKTYHRLMKQERTFANASNMGAMRKFGSLLDPGFFD